MTQRYKTALYAGTFNPFTVGHRDIALRALRLCDRLVIGIGRNIAKDASDRSEARADAIRRAMADCPQVEVAVYTGLTAEFARECGASFLVRGVRSVADFEAERNLADVNREISGLDTVLLTANPRHSFVSSSMVRELEANGFDASRWKA